MIILDDNGHELKNQLERLRGYLAEPRGASLAKGTTTGGGKSKPGSSANRMPPPARKEDIGDVPELTTYHGSVLDAFLGGEEEGGTPPQSGSSDRSDRRGPRAPPDSDGGIIAVARSSAPFEAEARAAVQAKAGVSPTAAAGSEAWDGYGGVGYRDGFVSPGVPTKTSVSGAAATESTVAMRENQQELDVSEAVHVGAEEDTVAQQHRSDSGGAERVNPGNSEGRERRVRTLMSAPGVDAASGLRGWRRRRDVDGADGASLKKVTIVQDVLSVLFGWEVAGGGKEVAAPNTAGKGVGRGGKSGASVMFA